MFCVSTEKEQKDLNSILGIEWVGFAVALVWRCTEERRVRGDCQAYYGLGLDGSKVSQGGWMNKMYHMHTMDY